MPNPIAPARVYMPTNMKTWWARFTVRGKDFRLSTGSEDKVEALKVAQNMAEAAKAGKDPKLMQPALEVVSRAMSGAGLVSGDLRDQIAMAAMGALLGRMKPEEGYSEDEIARASYAMAEAMLKVRQ